MTPRSWLLVPADDEASVRAALASEADALVFDLEDSVSPARKAAARELLASLLSAKPAGGPQRWVRVNPIESEYLGADLACCELLEIEGLVLPKVENGTQLKRLEANVVEADWKLHVIVSESAASLFQLDSFRGSSTTLAAMSWGIDDLSAALGASSKFDADGGLSFTYRLARSLCLAGARAAGVQPIDALFRDVDDEQRLRLETEAARREGFTGKLAIHPSQVAIINAAFTPSAAEIAGAQAIVDAFAAQPNAGILNVNGRMVDRPRLMQARGVLGRAGNA